MNNQNEKLITVDGKTIPWTVIEEAFQDKLPSYKSSLKVQEAVSSLRDASSKASVNVDTTREALATLGIVIQREKKAPLHPYTQNYIEKHLGYFFDHRKNMTNIFIESTEHLERGEFVSLKKKKSGTHFSPKKLQKNIQKKIDAFMLSSVFSTDINKLEAFHTLARAMTFKPIKDGSFREVMRWGVEQSEDLELLKRFDESMKTSGWIQRIRKLLGKKK